MQLVNGVCKLKSCYLLSAALDLQFARNSFINFATRAMHVFRGGVNLKLILTKSVGMIDARRTFATFTIFRMFSMSCAILYLKRCCVIPGIYAMERQIIENQVSCERQSGVKTGVL